MKNSTIQPSSYLKNFGLLFPELTSLPPWEIASDIQNILLKRMKTLGEDYKIQHNVAIHKKAQLEEHVILKGPIIISEDCFIAAHAYLRAGVFIGSKSVVGPGCEVKSSMLMPRSSLAHFNFVGDSLVGSGVNMEAGSIIANHHNDRADKSIFVVVDGQRTKINSIKFGALVGDNTKIGANAVLSPGTILTPESIVKRLELVEQ
jgi:UDP-N-acetylglucosamine diphosphorylase / glucose-1-phosphate thymidylyltransferase / UDP-N-acetylgalactosamine diphosphorylase / glucosamine-1-phosphate N-acetyltransferase / galactosamine-1-phosphate N-acetyltransferase